MKIISWNVNGLRALLKKEALEPLNQYNPDIICLQETKLSDGVELEIPGYQFTSFHNAQKPGYSGVGALAKKPLSIKGLGINEADLNFPQEGRVQTIDLGDFLLVNTYTPNSQRGLTRLDFRVQDWDVAYRSYIQELAKEKEVLLCGDFNVAHEEIDIANPTSNRKNAGFTDDERNSFTDLLNIGLQDVFRAHHPDEPDHYTWWSYRFNSRERNIGWRLDYFLATQALATRITNIQILKDIEGSDHAPVLIEIN